MTTTLSPVLIAAIVVIALFDLVMRIIALYRAAQHKQKGWFIAMCLLSTAGILPLIYMKYYKKAS